MRPRNYSSTESMNRRSSLGNERNEDIDGGTKKGLVNKGVSVTNSIIIAWNYERGGILPAHPL